MKCPACNARLSWRNSQGGGRFLCAACKNTGRIRRSYSLVVTAVGAVTAGLLAYALGARGDVLISSIFIGFYPTSLLIALISVQVFAPDLEPTGEFRAILYGGDSVDNPPVVSDEEQRRLRVGRILMNGLAVFAFICLLTGAAALFRIERSIYNVVPGLSSRSGPSAFPVTVRIEDDGLDFTNGSSGPWTCTSKIGIKEITSPTFALEAAQTRFVSYESFVDRAVPLSADDGYWKARERIIVQCLDDAGLTHFVVF
jgi:hypothetical protein